MRLTRGWHYLRRLARRLLIATLIVSAGALCGVAAVVFHYFVEVAQSLLIEPALRRRGLTRDIMMPTRRERRFSGERLHAWCT